MFMRWYMILNEYMKNVPSYYMDVSLTRCLWCAHTTSEWASSSDNKICTVSGIT